MMFHKKKVLTIVIIAILLTLAIAPAALAFDGREGGRVVIGADEVIADDLYIGAETLVVDGVIQGDLYTGAQSVTINGTVEGDLVTMAQIVIINGSVEDDVRAFAAAVQLGPQALVGDDLLVGAASVEMQTGGVVGGDMIVGVGQALVEGEVGGKLLAGASALTLTGSVAGDVTAYVDDPSNNDYEGMPPMFFGPQADISLPYVAPGITIADGARIGGNLTYSAYQDLSFPAGVVSGEIARIEPQYDASYEAPTPPTRNELFGLWALKLGRTIVTWLIIGLLLVWLFPSFISSAGYQLQKQPWHSLGWGVVAYAAFYFGLLVVFTAMLLGAMVFGFLTLGGLSGAIVALGALLLFALTVGFVITVLYITKIIISVLGGKLILAQFKPELANHKFWPLVVGVIVFATIMSVPLAGWLIKLITVLFGLGALWLLGRDKLGKTARAQEA